MYRRQGPDLLVEIRLTPRADRDAVDGPGALADGRIVLKVRVRAVPEDGKANAAAVSLIASHFGLPISAVTVESGHQRREKTLRIEGAGDEVEAALSRLAGP